MDISNLKIDQLKILAYDLMEKVDALNKDLNLVRNRITYLLQLQQEAEADVTPPSVSLTGKPVLERPETQKKR